VFLINDKINRINQIMRKKGITSKDQSINSKDQGQNYLIFMRYHVVPQDGMIIEHVIC
jgi:hypothetical protein